MASVIPSLPAVVELAGGPGELGRRHGEVLAREIREMRRALLDYLARLTLYVGALPALFLLQGSAVRHFWAQIPPAYREEIRGLAKGAQVHLPFLLLVNTLDDLANNWMSCSALAVGGEGSLEGTWIGGRNLDYPVFTDILVRLQTLFVYRPEQAQAFVSLAWPGYIGALTAMNRSRLCLSQLTALCRDNSLQGLPAGIRNRMALESASDPFTAAALLVSRRRTCGNNLLLFSPQGALVLELSARRHAVRRPRAGLLAATNHFQSAEMKAVMGASARRPPLSDLDPEFFGQTYSETRLARLVELASRRPLAPPDLQAILADPRIANPGTVSSVVFKPAELTLWVALKGPRPVSRGQFARFAGLLP